MLQFDAIGFLIAVLVKCLHESTQLFQGELKIAATLILPVLEAENFLARLSINVCFE